MESNLGPIEFCCDAPPYFIVQACRQLGIHDPEDVGWHRAKSPVPRSPAPGLRLPGIEALRKLLDKPGVEHCLCGGPAPRLDKCTFTLSSGREVNYLIGQCVACQAIFWDEADSIVAAPSEEGK